MASSTVSTRGQTAVSSLTHLRNRINLQTLARAAALFGVFVALFAYVQYGSAALAGNDGYYHIKMGYLISQQGLTPDFSWLPLTILNPDAYYNHHLLWHVYLALFAGVDPAVDGGAALTQSAKIASIIMPSLAGFMPRLACCRAFSISPMTPRSKGLTVTMRGSGTEMVASWFKGVGAP